MDILVILFYNNKIVVKILFKRDNYGKTYFFCRKIEEFSNSSRIVLDSNF